ncbi:MAG TPA: mitochondrial fission ELM1 family protein [Geminicoccaceae bacterium]|nr:mitochondrial fission ELM1 family protein [Geminicoccaceae bacterium]
MDALTRQTRRHPAAPAPTRVPRTWLLLGQKPGDNGQVLALAEALGWPFEAKRIVHRSTELLTNRLLGATLFGIDRRRSSPLAPPWPELVITAGRRNEPVARWIRRQAGGRRRTKLVHVGRPWAPLDEFDLIVTTPQYALPARPNVLHNEAPMHRMSPERLAEAAERWEPRLAELPRPWTAVMLGGHVGGWTFDAPAATTLATEANAVAAAVGGSLLVSTSARTPAEAVDAFVRAVRAPLRLYRWRKDDPDNPYFGFLALADRVIVTGDSMSMLIEAIATGKPVFVFDLARPASRRWRLPSLRVLVWRLGRVLGPRQLARDVGAIHRHQVAAGRASWLGQPRPPNRQLQPLEDTARAAARVRALFE